MYVSETVFEKVIGAWLKFNGIDFLTISDATSGTIKLISPTNAGIATFSNLSKDCFFYYCNYEYHIGDDYRWIAAYLGRKPDCPFKEMGIDFDNNFTHPGQYYRDPHDNLYHINNHVTLAGSLVYLVTVNPTFDIFKTRIPLAQPKEPHKMKLSPNNLKSVKCECGAIHTSNPSSHLKWCPLYKNDT
jgi:hypothetical protein